MCLVMKDYPLLLSAQTGGKVKGEVKRITETKENKGIPEFYISDKNRRNGLGSHHYKEKIYEKKAKT
jgi:predicted acetyltransferase